MHAGSAAPGRCLGRTYSFAYINLRSPLMFNSAIVYNASDDDGVTLSQEEFTSIQTFALSQLNSCKTQRGQHIWHLRHKETSSHVCVSSTGRPERLGGSENVTHACLHRATPGHQRCPLCRWEVVGLGTGLAMYIGSDRLSRFSNSTIFLLLQLPWG